MSAKKQSTKDYVKNPLTKRPIKVGGRVYIRMQKQGYFQDNDYADKQILEDLGEETENIKLIKKKIDELNQELPKNQQAVKGRGKYKNKIVKRYRKLPKKETTPSISEERAQARQLMELLHSLPEDGDMETQLAELLSGKKLQEAEAEAEAEEAEAEVEAEAEAEDTEVDSDYSEDEYEYDVY